MKQAIIQISYDPEYLEKEGTFLENEINGWLDDSRVNVTSIQDIDNIPEELKDLDPIETIWIMRQVKRSLDQLMEEKAIQYINDELIIRLVKELYENHETVDQDMEWRICDSLGIVPI